MNKKKTQIPEKQKKMPRIRFLSVEDQSDHELKVSETIFEVPLSWTLQDVQNEFEKRNLKRPTLFYSCGKKLNDLLFNIPYRTLTWTTNEYKFRVVEANGLEYLLNRGEGYRCTSVLKSLKSVNKCSLKIKADPNVGSGGVYFLKTSPESNASITACFKPRDDEPGSKNNPNHASQRDGVIPGESAEREVAAFVLDWNGFSGVPATLLVEADRSVFEKQSNSKIGSFQTFVLDAEETVGDFSPHLFPVREVHKIGILDLRYLNMDRNDANILVRQKNNEFFLVPIDHGLCFPDRIEVAWCDWVWWDWPQTLIPFDQETREWVQTLDIAHDMEVLERSYGLSSNCLKIFFCMSTLLKKGVQAGLTLRDIASVVVRSVLEEPSSMEKTFTRALELAAIQDSNSRNKPSNGHRISRSSSFDGNLVPKQEIPDKLFYLYVDRLIEDTIAEILLKKTHSSPSTEISADGWFSASTKSSPCELTKLASPRLMPIKVKPPTEEQLNALSRVPVISLQ